MEKSGSGFPSSENKSLHVCKHCTWEVQRCFSWHLPVLVMLSGHPGKKEFETGGAALGVCSFSSN